MPIEPILHGNHTQASQANAEKQSSATQLIAELEGAGLLSIEVDDDADVSFELTRRGHRAAHMMAMGRDGHALVLLGALVSTGHRPN